MKLGVAFLGLTAMAFVRLRSILMDHPRPSALSISRRFARAALLSDRWRRLLRADRRIMPACEPIQNQVLHPPRRESEIKS